MKLTERELERIKGLRCGVFQDVKDDLVEALERQNEALKNANDCISEEINPSNYDHETVCKLRQEWDEALSIIQSAILPKE